MPKYLPYSAQPNIQFTLSHTPYCTEGCTSSLRLRAASLSFRHELQSFATTRVSGRDVVEHINSAATRPLRGVAIAPLQRIITDTIQYANTVSTQLKKS